MLPGIVDLVGNVIAEALLMGFTPTAMCYSWLASERLRRELARAVAEFGRGKPDAIRAEQPSRSKRKFWLAGLAGVLIATLLRSYFSPTPLASFLLEGWEHHKAFDYGLTLA